MLLGMFLRSFGFSPRLLHDRVTSDIPGNPHCFDTSIISLFRTLPEPSNFNLVWTAVPIKRNSILIIKGQIPFARCNSLTIYNANDMSSIPYSIDLDLVVDSNGKFTIVIIRDDTSTSSFKEVVIENPSLNSGFATININLWNCCLISMRNYLVPSGLKITSPSISLVSLRQSILNVEVIRKSRTLKTGAAALQAIEYTSHSILFKSLSNVLLLNLFVLLMKLYTLSTSFELAISVLQVVCGIVVAFLFRLLCFELGKKSLKKSAKSLTNSSKHQFFLPSPEISSKVSQPSNLHQYLMMEFDLTQHGTQVNIKCKLNSCYQKYWSFIIYDEYGMPYPEYVFDGNLLQRKKSKMQLLSDGSCSYECEIELFNKGHQFEINEDDGNAVRINVHDIKKGYVIFRLVHLNCKFSTSEILKFSFPQVSVSSEKDD